MWCSSCQQDVPGLASPVDGAPCCPRCNREVEGATLPFGCDGGQRHAVGSAKVAVSKRPAALPDQWELDQEMRHIERMLFLGAQGDRHAKTVYRREAARYDVGHAVVPQWHVHRKPQLTRRKRTKTIAAPRATIMMAVTWFAFSAGTTALFCGGALLAWSVAANRGDLWNMGLPTTLGGQIGLLLGVAFRLERLWRENHSATSTRGTDESRQRPVRTARAKRRVRA